MSVATPDEIREIPYRLHWRVGSASVGAHRGLPGGELGILRDTVDFWRQPDPRRIDMRQSLRDPRQRIQVRRFEQRSTITVVAVIDLSGSMGFERVGGNKMQIAAEVCQGIALFARRVGDAFGMVGCDNQVREDFILQPSRRQGVERQVARLFAATQPSGRGAGALSLAARHLPRRRALVLLISDFRLPLEQLEQTLVSLAGHDVVPLQIEDRRETEGLPRWGLLQVQDLESRRRRLLCMRPSLRAAWLASERQRHQALSELFTRHGRNPFQLTDRWQPDSLSEHLLVR
jgi:uncharacterized protein (DUF58 family)